MEETEKSNQPIQIDKLCRSCMNEKNNMQSIFGELEMAGQQAQLSEMLMACAAVQVICDDGLPDAICETCVSQLSNAYTFKQQCENTDKKLREFANMPPLSNIKVERNDAEALSIVVKPDIDIMSEMIYDDDSNFQGRSDSDTEWNEKSKKKLHPNQCKFCNKKLSSRQGLKIHMRKHTGENLKIHTRKANEKSHVCSICGAGFNKAFHLLKHKQEHKTSKNGEKETENKDTTETPVTENKSDIKSEFENNELIIKSDDDVGMDDIGMDDIGMDDDDGFNDIPDPVKYVRKDKGTYECKICQKILTTATGLQIHMRRHTGHNLSQCYVCNKSFTKTSHLKRHLSTHGAAVEAAQTKPAKVSLPCEFCDRKFVYRKSFVHHMRSEHGISDDENIPLSAYIKTEMKDEERKENSETVDGQVADGALDDEGPDEIDELTGQKKVFECHVCQHQFGRSNHLTRHMTLHRNVLKHKCDNCEKSFLTEEHLQKHVQEFHLDRPYICTICNKPFARGEHLIRHLKVHDKDKKDGAETLEHKCSICDKIFTRSDHLARHTKLHLMKDKRHVCTVCNKSFNRLDNLRTHQRVHTGQRDPVRLHLCVYCGKEFNNSSNMIVHMRRHTGERPYKCTVCGKGFPRSHDLKCHERTHSGERPYLCTLCGKSFNKSNKLVRHTRVHTGERPYVCNICGRAFTQSNDLALHMRRHTGSRPYACGVCPARFIQSGQLKAHRRSQGHWVEQEIQFRGNRVEPVHIEGLVETPIKHRNRVKNIVKQELTVMPEVFANTSLLALATGSNVPPPKDFRIIPHDENEIKPTTSASDAFHVATVTQTYQPSATTSAGPFTTSESFNFQQYDSVM